MSTSGTTGQPIRRKMRQAANPIASPATKPIRLNQASPATYWVSPSWVVFAPPFASTTYVR